MLCLKQELALTKLGHQSSYYSYMLCISMLALKLLLIGGQFYGLKEFVAESHPESKDRYQVNELCCFEVNDPQ
jgi:hypothetical protein